MKLFILLFIFQLTGCVNNNQKPRFYFQFLYWIFDSSSFSVWLSLRASFNDLLPTCLEGTWKEFTTKEHWRLQELWIYDLLSLRGEKIWVNYGNVVCMYVTYWFILVSLVGTLVCVIDILVVCSVVTWNHMLNMGDRIYKELGLCIFVCSLFTKNCEFWQEF